MASLVPTSRLSSVDLPAFGRPMSETKPDFIDRLAGRLRRRGSCGHLRGAIAHLVDPPALGVEHLDAQAVDSNRSPTAGTRPRCDSR